MAIKISSTTVFNNNNAIDWSLISSKPQHIGSLIKTDIGDGTLGTSAPASNVAYHSANNTLQIWFNSNCQCQCDCQCSCFLGHTKVLMANGTEKRIDEIRPGDWIACHFNGSAPVLAIRRGKVSDNKMYKINNDLITTGEHGFWIPSTQEWAMCDRSEDNRESRPWRLVSQGSLDTPAIWRIVPGVKPRQMKVGDRVMVKDTTVEITKIEKINLNPEIPVYTCITTSSMIVHGGWVASAWSGADYDKPIIGDINRRLHIMRGTISPSTRWSQ